MPVVLACAFLTASAQNHSIDSASVGMSFSYKFENPRFVHLPLIEIDLDSSGKGKLRFKRNESDDIIELDFNLMPGTLARIRQLYSETGFLTSTENYQSKKDFSHLGWITLTAHQGEQSRQTRFNYTTNLQIDELATIFRAIATQQIQLFDIENVQQYQPLDLASQLDALENDLRLERIAEPESLLAALREIAANDTALLIARNKAS
ncbi:MAG: hypothetical protein AB1631_34340, partial [Acidobacteriota bacterium]